MKNLSFKNRILVASPAIALMLAGTVIWDMKILAVIGIGYLFIIEMMLKKKKEEPGDK
jgi:hypothetical protein